MSESEPANRHDQRNEIASGIWPRLGRAFGWSATGNYLYAGAQFLVLLTIVSKGTPNDVASFLLALAITAPIFLTLSLNLSAALASDSAGAYTARAYVVSRIVTTVTGIGLATIAALLLGGGSDSVLAIILMGFAKASESISNLAQGAYLRAEKHQLVAVSQVSLAVFGYGSFAVVFISTGNLEASLAALAIGWLVSALIVDSFLLKKVINSLSSLTGSDSAIALARHSFPLGLERGASALAAYLPLIALDISGATVLLVAAFGVVSQTVRVIQVFARTSSFALIPLLSRLSAAGETDVLASLFRKLFLIVGIGSVIVLGVAAWVGDDLVTWVFGPTYVVDGLIEIVALNGASVVFLALTMSGLLSFRKFQLVLRVRVLAIAVTAVFLVFLTGPYGALGVAWAAVLGTVTSVAVGAAMIRTAIRT